MSIRFFQYAILIFSCLVSANALYADTIVYGDLEGPDMLFTDVTESAVNEVLPLFGQPEVSGNSLVFPNPSFAAIATTGSLEFIDGRMTVNVAAKNNGYIHSLKISEHGSYVATGDDVILSAGAIGFAVAEGQVYSGNFQFTTDTAGVGTWEGSFIIEFPDPVQSASFVVDNQLFAFAGADSSALIGKDGVTLTVNSVPEPLSIIGFATAIGIACSRRRRIHSV